MRVDLWIAEMSEEQANDQHQGSSFEDRRAKLARARIVLRKTREFRNELERDLINGHFSADDLKMRFFTDLLVSAMTCFPDDAPLQMIPIMPDGDPTLSGLAALSPRSNRYVTERVKTNVDRLILRLDMIFGVWFSDDDVSRETPSSTASDVLHASRGTTAETVAQAVRQLLTERPANPEIEERSFDFVRDAALRGVLSADYVDTQRSYAARSFKPATISAAGVIEGVVLDALKWPETQAHPAYSVAVRTFSDEKSGEIQDTRASLLKIVQAAQEVGLISQASLRLIGGVADYRDSVHAAAEVRYGKRPGPDEALLTITLMKMIYTDIAALAANSDGGEQL